jgi:hypothetical protein
MMDDHKQDLLEICKELVEPEQGESCLDFILSEAEYFRTLEARAYGLARCSLIA